MIGYYDFISLRYFILLKYFIPLKYFILLRFFDFTPLKYCSLLKYFFKMKYLYHVTYLMVLIYRHESFCPLTVVTSFNNCLAGQLAIIPRSTVPSNCASVGDLSVRIGGSKWAWLYNMLIGNCCNLGRYWVIV